ncbi:MAG: ribosome maturation factor RimP [Candidatus Bipolaricaulota bacterium]
MERVQEKLDALVHRGAAEAEVEVYHWELRRQGQRMQLAVQVDRPGGVTLDDCARANRVIGSLLDEEDPVPNSYLLEVSSPGVERALFDPRHYVQAVGKLIQVRTQQGSSLRGRLTQVAPGAIVLVLDGTETEIPFAEIASARIVYEQGHR